MAELPKLSRLLGKRAEKHDGDVRFFTGSGNTAVSCMRNTSCHNYCNNSFFRSLWTWLWGRYHVPQNVFLVYLKKWNDLRIGKHGRNWCIYCSCFEMLSLKFITALHAMQTRSSDENSVCLSVRPSVCLSNVKTPKRYEIRCHLLVITNRKSHTRFRLIPISMILNALERRNSPYFAFFT